MHAASMPEAFSVKRDPLRSSAVTVTLSARSTFSKMDHLHGKIFIDYLSVLLQLRKIIDEDLAVQVIHLRECRARGERHRDSARPQRIALYAERLRHARRVHPARDGSPARQALHRLS